MDISLTGAASIIFWHKSLNYFADREEQYLSIFSDICLLKHLHSIELILTTLLTCQQCQDMCDGGTVKTLLFFVLTRVGLGV